MLMKTQCTLRDVVTSLSQADGMRDCLLCQDTTQCSRSQLACWLLFEFGPTSGLGDLVQE